MFILTAANGVLSPIYRYLYATNAYILSLMLISIKAHLMTEFVGYCLDKYKI